MKTKKILLWSSALLGIDQIVKVVIYQYFLDLRFDIIPPLFYFKPKFNYNYTWINDIFQLGVGYWIHIILFVFVSIFLVIFYDWSKTISGNAKIINIAFIFGFAGILSVWACTIFWQGVLDYIYLKPLFIFDLKDLYLNLFVALYLLYFLKNRKYMASLTNKDMLNHIKKRFALLFKNRKLLK